VMTTLFTRKIMALLLVLTMLVGTVPIAAAANHPASAMASMTMSTSGMPCRKSMPPPERQVPCKNMQNCLGMLGCATAVALPQSVVTELFEFQILEQSWALQGTHDSIALQPDHPPPIV
jgi:hypothetical protein